MTMKINKPDVEMVTPTPAMSKDPIANGIAVPVFNKEADRPENTQVGTKTLFKRSRFPENVSLPRNPG